MRLHLISSCNHRDANKWKKLRRLTEMAFHKSMLPNYNPILNKHAKNLVYRLSDRLGGKHSDLLDDIAPFISYCAIDVLIGLYLS